MTIGRAHSVDPAVTRWYHCVARCVRREFLLGEMPNDRKVWIENRLQELAQMRTIGSFPEAFGTESTAVGPISRRCRTLFDSLGVE